MRKTIAALTLIAAIAAPATAGAKTNHWNWCAPGPVIQLLADNTSCSTAKTVERYWDHHEVFGPQRIAGRTWRITINRHYIGDIYQTTYRSGSLVIQIDSLPYQ